MSNLSRRNHDKLVCQEAIAPQCLTKSSTKSLVKSPERIVSLKGILLYWLNVFFTEQYSANCEENSNGFIDFSHNSEDLYPSAALTSSPDAFDWSKVPLQKKKTAASVLYSSALPQIICKRSSGSSLSTRQMERSQQAAAQKIVDQLRQFQMQSVQRYVVDKDPVLCFLLNIWKAFEIDSDRPGWIGFRLSKKGTIQWMQHLLENDLMSATNHTLVINQLFTSCHTASPTSSAEAISTSSKENVQTSHPLINTNCSTIDGLASCIKPSNYTQQTEKQAMITLPDQQLDQQLWEVQYTYARCCSFIHQCTNSRLASRVTQNTQYAESLDASSKIPLPGQQLADALIDTSDAMFWIPYRYPSKQYLLLLKSAGQLCQSFERFHREELPGISTLDAPVRLALSTAPACPQLSNLSLVAATRNILKALLQVSFRATAPKSL